ncbi:MAG: anti-sigma factor family protein [Longimicrobiaceae bacterium]
MTDHPWADRLSEYLDGDLAVDEAALLERHLAVCAECRRALGELERVRDRLRADSIVPADQPSQAELAAVQGRIAGEGVPLRARRAARGRWLVGGVVGMAMAAGVAAIVLMAGEGNRAPGILPPVRVAAASSPYDEASRELEAELRRNRAQLGPESAEALARTLAGIDRAIAEAQRARAADPGNDFVARHLDRLRGERISTLRDALAAVRS